MLFKTFFRKFKYKESVKETPKAEIVAAKSHPWLTCPKCEPNSIHGSDGKYCVDHDMFMWKVSGSSVGTRNRVKPTIEDLVEWRRNKKD